MSDIQRDDLTRTVIELAQKRDDATGDATVAAIERLEADLERYRKIHRFDRATINRWVPCSGHRDKTTNGVCYVCENERLRNLLRRVDNDPMSPGTRAAVRREIADGRAFK